MQVKNIAGKMAFIALMFVSAAGYAQRMPQRTPQDRADRQTRWMEKHLEISPRQSGQVYDIMLHYVQEKDRINNEPTGQQKKMQKMDNEDRVEHELRRVLTPRQYRDYEEHIQEKRAMARERRNGRMTY